MAIAPQDQNNGERRSHRGFIYLIAEDIHQNAKQVCQEALIAQQEAQERVRMSRLAQQGRQSDRVERALCRAHQGIK
jgi:hypothetical protein